MHKPNVAARTLRRASLLALFMLIVFVFLLVRIFAVQVFDFEKYQRKVLDQLTTESPVRAARGAILDARGRVLATNRTVYRVSLFPRVIARDEAGERARAAILAGLPALLPGLTAEKLTEHLDHTGELERTVARAVERETAERVLIFIKENGLADMLAVEAVNARYYPEGTLAAHVLGFTGSDGQGLYGLELQYDELLSGKNGSYVTARDATGTQLPNNYEAFDPAVDGCTLHTTLDACVQAVLERELERTLTENNAQNRVCGIVMDVNTGAILGMATAPAFDPNEPFELTAAAAAGLAACGYAEGSEEYAAKKAELLAETWSNKAVTEIYMPGSTFKTLTCSMVLEEGAVTDLEERFYCSGVMGVADRLIHCHKRTGHGSLTFREGLQQSCNPVMMTVAARFGLDAIYEYFGKFGLSERTGIDLPGEGNSIFHAKSAFTELDLATASFGQNFKVSVLQMITAVSAVANGGELVTPYLVETVTDADGNTVYAHERTVKRRVIGEETAGTISEILAEGVAGSGGAKNAYAAGYRVAAKTGTSEKIGDDRNARVGSCVGYAPADDPQVAVIVMVDEPTGGSRYGSVVAAPYLAAVMESILPYLGVEPAYTPEEEAARTVTIPDFCGMTARDAEKLLGQSTLGFEFAGEGEIVRSQSPAAGSTVLMTGARVVLTLGDAALPETTVPDVTGLTAAAAREKLTACGLCTAATGARDYLKDGKTVAAQSAAAGEKLPRGSVVTIRFLYDESEE